MAVLKVRVTPETFDRLAELAANERRPVPWQAELMLAEAVKAPARDLEKRGLWLTDLTPAPANAAQR